MLNESEPKSREIKIIFFIKGVLFSLDFFLNRHCERSEAIFRICNVIKRLLRQKMLCNDNKDLFRVDSFLLIFNNNYSFIDKFTSKIN